MVELCLGHPPPFLALVEGIQGILGGPHLHLGALVNVHVAVAVLPEGLGVGLWPANDQVWLFSILTAFFTNHVGVFEHNRGTFSLVSLWFRSCGVVPLMRCHLFAI